MEERVECVVLVTGGGGFLGQHVVGLLQTRADHVTEIRVLDVIPFENKLDYKHTKPLRSIVGSITDETTLFEACRGVQSVIHIAGIPDSNMFPDKEKINNVNIRGTMLTLLAALSTPGVQRMIYCSSMSVAIGDSDITGAITESDPIPQRRLFEPYASSKLAGERIVLAANTSSFRTIVLRPLVMWGELDTIFVSLSQRMAGMLFGYLPTINNDVTQSNAYVGNTAWGFVCAERSLYNERQNDGNKKKYADDKRKNYCSELRRRSTQKSKKDTDVFSDLPQSADDKTLSKNIYYIADDTPVQEPFAFQKPFLEATGYRLTSYRTPLFIFAMFFYLLYGVLALVRMFGVKANFPVGLGCIDYYKRPYVFCDAKARQELGYKPLYTPEEARERAMPYYKTLSYK